MIKVIMNVADTRTTIIPEINSEKLSFFFPVGLSLFSTNKQISSAHSRQPILPQRTRNGWGPQKRRANGGPGQEFYFNAPDETCGPSGLCAASGPFVPNSEVYHWSRLNRLP